MAIILIVQVKVDKTNHKLLFQALILVVQAFFDYHRV